MEDLIPGSNPSLPGEKGRRCKDPNQRLSRKEGQRCKDPKQRLTKGARALDTLQHKESIKLKTIRQIDKGREDQKTR